MDVIAGAMERALFAYAAGIDTKDYELFRTAFTPDVQAVYPGFAGPFDGVDELADYMEQLHRDLDGSLHRITNVVVLEHDGSTAKGRSYLDAMLFKADVPDGDLFNARGIYHNTFVRSDDDRWLISDMHFTYMYGSGNPGVVSF